MMHVWTTFAIRDTLVQCSVSLRALSKFPASIQAATTSHQKHDIHHCMALTDEIRSLADGSMSASEAFLALNGQAIHKQDCRQATSQHLWQEQHVQACG